MALWWMNTHWSRWWSFLSHIPLKLILVNTSNQYQTEASRLWSASLWLHIFLNCIYWHSGTLLTPTGQNSNATVLMEYWAAECFRKWCVGPDICVEINVCLCLHTRSCQEENDKLLENISNEVAIVWCDYMLTDQHVVTPCVCVTARQKIGL